MEAKTVKISKQNYEWLCEIAGKVQIEEKRSISIDEAISKLRSSGKLSDLAGAWDISDKQARKLLKDIRKGWRNWKIGYV
ncbi:MAG TPA: hypothetical protein VJB94_01690 [Candidatus Nanoarchaeia archaeon]|nr:hypothetical protein [Candidatus Nanoarchaeia archaeon]